MQTPNVLYRLAGWSDACLTLLLITIML